MTQLGEMFHWTCYMDKEEMVENVKIKDSLGYSKHEDEAGEFTSHREESKK